MTLSEDKTPEVRTRMVTSLHDIEVVQAVVVLEDLTLDLGSIYPRDKVFEFPDLSLFPHSSATRTA